MLRDGACWVLSAVADVCLTMCGVKSLRGISISSENWAFVSSPSEPRTCEDCRVNSPVAGWLLFLPLVSQINGRPDASRADGWFAPISPQLVIHHCAASRMQSFDCSHALNTRMGRPAMTVGMIMSPDWFMGPWSAEVSCCLVG